MHAALWRQEDNASYAASPTGGFGFPPPDPVSWVTSGVTSAMRLLALGLLVIALVAAGRRVVAWLLPVALLAAQPLAETTVNFAIEGEPYPPMLRTLGTSWNGLAGPHEFSPASVWAVAGLVFELNVVYGCLWLAGRAAHAAPAVQVRTVALERFSAFR